MKPGSSLPEFHGIFAPLLLSVALYGAPVGSRAAETVLLTEQQVASTLCVPGIYGDRCGGPSDGAIGMLLGTGLLGAAGYFTLRQLRKRNNRPSEGLTGEEDSFVENEVKGTQSQLYTTIHNNIDEGKFLLAHEAIQEIYLPINTEISGVEDNPDLTKQQAIDFLRRMLEEGSLYQSLSRDEVLGYYHFLGGEGNPEPKDETDAIGVFQDSGIDLEAIGDVDPLTEAQIYFAHGRSLKGFEILATYVNGKDSNDGEHLEKIQKWLNKTPLEGENEVERQKLLRLIKVRLGLPLNGTSGRLYDSGDSLTGEMRPLSAPGDVISISDKREELLLSLTTGGKWDSYLFNGFIEGDRFSDNDKIATCSYLITNIIEVGINVLEFIGAINGIANQELREKISREIIRHNNEFGTENKRLVQKGPP